MQACRVQHDSRQAAACVDTLHTRRPRGVGVGGQRKLFKLTAGVQQTGSCPPLGLPPGCPHLGCVPAFLPALPPAALLPVRLASGGIFAFILL